LTEALANTKRPRRQKKVRISADGAPYTVWQTRTHVLCLIYLAWAVCEIALGLVFIALRFFGLPDPTTLVPLMTFGPSTVLSGSMNLVVALLGLWGAYNPRRIAVFFWFAIIAAVLVAWQVASDWSMGILDPASLVSLAVTFTYAACAWNVRGQTGYFDRHPHPEDEELPIQHDVKALETAVREKTLELEAAKQSVETELKDVKLQLETAKRQLSERK
jgi:hypothetical protein